MQEYWNNWNTVGSNIHHSPLNAQGHATGIDYWFTDPIVYGFGDWLDTNRCPISVSGAEALNRSGNYTSSGDSTYSWTVSGLPTGGSGKWDLYLYFNTDDPVISFTAAVGSVSVSDTLTHANWSTPPEVTTWTEGAGYWVLSDLTPVEGALTLNVSVTAGTYLWVNGFQLAQQDVAPVPGSSTLALLGVAGLLMGFPAARALGRRAC